MVLRADKFEDRFSFESQDGFRFQCVAFLENKSLREQALVVAGSIQCTPQEIADKQVPMWARMTLASSSRNDGYFESFLVKPGKSVPLRIDIRLEKNDETTKWLKERKEFSFLVSYTYYGRRPMKTDWTKLLVPLNAFSRNESAFSRPVNMTPIHTPKKNNVIPIRTHILFPGENLGDVIRTYAGNLGKPGDWIAIAESAVAIAQGRVYSVFSIHPGFWARRLNRLFQFDSSLASCYSMEWAIRQAGVIRILFGVVVGLLGKLIGRSGDFYRIAGRNVATIDDCTGTLPPFDKSVVLGPANPSWAAEAIKKQTGYEVAVVDANDLGKVDILGKTSGIDEQILIQSICDNPQGNADEQTPIVLIRR